MGPPAPAISKHISESSLGKLMLNSRFFLSRIQLGCPFLGELRVDLLRVLRDTRSYDKA